jgi:sulfate/thiosulfate transport system substrate-binding protein
MTRLLVAFLFLPVVSIAILIAMRLGQPGVQVLNVSFDPTRELYADLNRAFAKTYNASATQPVSFQASHGGSGKQARSVIDGLRADVVTLALSHDIDAIAKKAKLLPENWRDRLPNHSVPYTSTIVFLVRKGNPKQIHDWPDLARDGVSVITPNPKTSGGARWNYLAAWGWALKSTGSEAGARDYVSRLYRNVPVLDSGARGATTTFAQRHIGDVLISWESEAQLIGQELSSDLFDVITPPTSILAELPVAWVDGVTESKGTTAVARAYLQFMFTREGQRILARHHFRPVDPAVASEFAGSFPAIDLFTVESLLGGWDAAQKKHFDDGGVFDQIYVNR